MQIAYASPNMSIGVATAYNMIANGSYPDLVVCDVRNEDEYDSGNIYGAVWIPVMKLEARIGELTGHEKHEITVYMNQKVMRELINCDRTVYRWMKKIFATSW